MTKREYKRAAKAACECEQTTTPETPAENETKGEKTTMTKKEMDATVEALENAYTNSITEGESPLTTCKAFIETVGAAAASQCMAVMVRRLHWDGRISRTARAWADGVQVDEAWSLYQVEAYSSRIHSSHLSQLAESMGEALEQVAAEAEAEAETPTEAPAQTTNRSAIDALIKDLVKIQLEELILDSEVAEDESRTEQERAEAAQRKQDTIKTLPEVYNVPQSVLSRAIEIGQDIDHDTYDVEASKIMDEIKGGSYTAETYEDNSGRHHLAVLNTSGICVYYLVADKELVEQTAADLRAGGDPVADQWEGGEPDPVAAYQWIRDTVEERSGGAWETELETGDTQPAPALTIEQVAEALAENQSAEFEQESVVYWLHVTESGEIVPNYPLADNDFCYKVSYDRYGITGQEENPQKIYDTETMSNPIFAEIVKNLTERANLWLEQVRTAEARQDTIKKYFFEFDEIWGENPSECVEELERMSDALESLYMTLGPGMYERSIDERTEAKSQRMTEILKNYGCHVYRLHETYLDLKNRGELELYIKYRKEMGSL